MEVPMDEDTWKVIRRRDNKISDVMTFERWIESSSTGTDRYTGEGEELVE